MTPYRSAPNRLVPADLGALFLALIRLAERRMTCERRAPLFDEFIATSNERERSKARGIPFRQVSDGKPELRTAVLLSDAAVVGISDMAAVLEGPRQGAKFPTCEGAVQHHGQAAPPNDFPVPARVTTGISINLKGAASFSKPSRLI